MRTSATEDVFLGAMMGMAIGDALGASYREQPSQEQVTGYAGETGAISDKSEIALCFIESLTMNDGLIDAENIGARLAMIAGSPSAETMTATTLAGIQAVMNDQPVPEPAPEEIEIATRGVPFGLMEAIGEFDASVLRSLAAEATAITHGGEAAVSPVYATALAVYAAAIYQDAMVEIYKTHTADLNSSSSQQIAAIVQKVAESSVFEESVFAIVAEGGVADATGAIAGAIAGARFGASGIPQHLIDDLDARIYLSLAASWFYRLALRRQGTVIDLRTVQ